jgi:hypothetical protein
VLATAELALRDDYVKMLELLLKVTGIAPVLERPPVSQDAADALPAAARLAAVAPENMGRTYQPVLVRFVNLEGVAGREHSRPTHERDVVELDDVEPALGQFRPDLPSVDDGSASLVGEQRSERTEPASQPYHFELPGLRPVSREFVGSQKTVCVDVVNYRDLVATLDEGA